MAGVASKVALCRATMAMIRPSTTSSAPLLFRFSTATDVGGAVGRWGKNTFPSMMAPTFPPKKATPTLRVHVDSAVATSNRFLYLCRSFQTASSSSMSTAAASPTTRLTTASIVMRHQLPVLLIPLPSRRDEAGCEFVVRPSSSTVEQLLADIQKEDPGIERIFVTVDGTRVAKRTAMQHLLAQGFDLHVNEVVYPVAPLPTDVSLVEYEAMNQTEADEVKDLVKNLYAVLNMRPHLMEQSAELRRQVEANRLELAALEQQLDTIKTNTERKLVQFNFFNLFLMSVQFGMFARLTWWEYSWDIMEPVTYFTTTFHAMVLVFGWSVLTRKDLLYPVAADHFYLKWLYKLSGKHKFDIERYNTLKEKIYEDESALKRIRTPLESNFWISPPLPHSKE